MNIVITHQKGGTAKSTTALMLITALNEAGKSLEIVDLDPQQSLLGWLEGIGIESIQGADYKITDTPPSVFDADTNKAIAEADLVIVPSGTSVSEMQVTASTLPLIKESTKGEVKILWSRIQANTQASKALGDFSEALASESFRTSIGMRQCYQQGFIANGWKGLNRQAKEEVSQFTLEAVS